MESDHHFSFNPDCNSTADVPSFYSTSSSFCNFLSLRLWGVAVRWFHANSSQGLPNSHKQFVWVTFGFCDGSRNFRKFFSVASATAPKTFVNSSPSLVKFWFRTDSIHWMVRSCTTTAYRWLFRDSHHSLRTLWTAVIKSPNFLAQ